MEDIGFHGISYGGYAISLERVSNLISTYKSEVIYDASTKSMKAIVTIKESDVKPKVNGKTWHAGTYTIWYENAETISKKLELVNNYDIKGSGYWRLGLEESSLWEKIGNLITGNNIFNDVSDSYWAADAITFLKEKGWIKGKNENNYMPEAPITRAEMASIICRILNVDIENTENVDIYSDTNNHWAKNAINATYIMGIFSGYSDGTFKPDANITRGEIAKVLSLLAENLSKTREYQDFIDVNLNNWAYKYIKDINEKGIVNGYSDNTYRSENSVLRSEVAMMIYNIYGK